MNRVKFVVFKGEITAVFPDVPWNRSGDLTCYAHVGQHGACSASLLRCPSASYDQAKDLLAELRRIGYDDLRIVNRWPDEYELRWVDAWGNKDDGYEWNESRFVGAMKTSSRNVARAFRRKLREIGYDYGRGYAVRYDGDVYELVERKTGKPVFAALYMEGGAK